jgi:hypothetical protein
MHASLTIASTSGSASAAPPPPPPLLFRDDAPANVHTF